MTRIAQIDLGRLSSPKQADFDVAANLLQIAHDLDPENEQILRLLIEAVGHAGDRDQVTALSRRLLALDPGDTVTQLRVISDAIAASQNVDERLAVYDRFLGPQGRKLDASIRSRLALDSALLFRERGDIARFAERLALAAELDPTNKDAAALAVTFFTQRVDDALGRFELLENLLLADPFDPETHLALARELNAAGAWSAAQRFYGMYSQIRAHYGRPAPEQVAAESVTAQWNEHGAAALLRDLRENVESRRERLRNIRRQLEAAGQPLDGVDSPESVRLSASVERVRLMAAAALGDVAQLEYARQEYIKALRTQEDYYSNDALLEQGLTQEQLDTALRVIRAEAAWVFLWAGFNIDEAEQIIEAMAEKAENPEALARYRGLLFLRRGDIAGARALLEPLTEDHPLVLIGLAIAEELEGDPEAAADIHVQITRRMAGSLAGAWARTRYEVLAGKPAPLPPEAGDMRRLGNAVPTWLDALVARPSSAVHLRTQLRPDTIDLLQPARLTITLKNASQIPLAVGPEKPINSRLLLSPAVQVGVNITPSSGTDLSSVLSADRRLRLMPGQTMSLEVDPTGGVLGAVLYELAGRSVRVRWRLLQGFTISETGAYTRGPLGEATQTPMLYRQPSRRVGAGAQQLEEWIRTGSARNIAEVLCLLRWRQAEGETRALPEDEMLALGRAVAERYPQLDRAERMLVISCLPMRRNAPWLAPVDEALAAEPDPDVALLAIVVRADGTDSPLLAAAVDSADERVRSAAERQRGQRDPGSAKAEQSSR